MSKAEDYAKARSKLNATYAELVVNIGGVQLEVEDDGRLLVDTREARLKSEDAIKIANWILDTFGVPL